MSRLLPFILIALCTIPALGQPKASVQGVISEIPSGQPLPFANIVLTNTRFATTSDDRGYFQLQGIPYGTYEIIVTSIGYQPLKATLSVDRSRVEQNFTLSEDVQQLEEVVVQSEKQSTIQEQKPIAIKSVDIREVITQNTLLTDVADRISGVRIRRSSSLGEKSDISINGMRGNAVRVYIDGLPMEFVYPNFDISTIPLSNIKRMDVYKGVLPVDVGTDAMGGAINIITETAMGSHVRASYGIGSFNTHMADFEVGLAGKKNFFASFNGAYNYSDNDYSMKALVYETNRVEKVKRFHDGYQMGFAGINFGVHSKSWADELRFSANVSTGYKELQNGARVTTFAIGQAKYTSQNYTASLKYTKAFFNERLAISNILSYSYQNLDFVDTTSNVYSWSGEVVGRTTQGEYFGEANNVTHYANLLDRTTIGFNITEDQRISVSNLYATQKLTGKDRLKDDDERDYLTIPQYLTKNITGVQYDGRFFGKLNASAAIKRFGYILDGAENNTFILITKKDNFFGWNASLKYDITDRVFVKTSYERGFLIPYFEQFVGNGADIVRNTNLRPESSDNVNLGFGYATRPARTITAVTNINAFYREQYDVIFVGNSVVKRYENADQVNTVGVEGDLVISYNKSWTWRNNVTLLRKQFSHMKDPRNAFLEGTTFPNNPTFYANTELSWQKMSLVRPGDQLRVYGYYQYVAPFNHILIGQQDNVKNSPASFVPLQNRVDVGASYRFAKQHVTAAFNVVNILNAELYDNFLVPRAGINFNAKLIFEIRNLKKQ